MIVTGATIDQLSQALQMVNSTPQDTTVPYNGNITFRSIEPISKNRVRFTLTVKDSKGPGGRLGFPDYQTGKQRSVKAACWHAHGDFFDALFTVAPSAVVRTAGNKITKGAGNWEDRNIGSMMHPLLYSEACHCDET